jgi:hypothetical protein
MAKIGSKKNPYLSKTYEALEPLEPLEPIFEGI